MFKKSITISLTIFFFLMVFTSVIKNSTRNIAKSIEKLNSEVSILESELMNAKIDYSYLSSPENLKKNILGFNKEKYFSYEASRIFLSTKDFINFDSKQTKNFEIEK